MEVAAAALDFTPTGCRPVEVAAAALDFTPDWFRQVEVGRRASPPTVGVAGDVALPRLVADWWRWPSRSSSPQPYKTLSSSDLMSQSSADLAAPPSPIAQSQVSSRHPLSTDLVVTVTAPTVISHSLIFLFH